MSNSRAKGLSQSARYMSYTHRKNFVNKNNLNPSPASSPIIGGYLTPYRQNVSVLCKDSARTAQ